MSKEYVAESLDELSLLVQPEHSENENIERFQYKEPSSDFNLCSPSIIFTIFMLTPLLIPLFIVYLLNSLCWRKRVNTYAYRSTAFNKSLVHTLIEQVGFYNPPWWYNNHIGTLFSFGASPMLIFEREVYYLADGTCFAIDWYPKAPCNLKPTLSGEPQLVAMYLPGLGQSSDNNVFQVFAKDLAEKLNCICGIMVPKGHLHSGLPLPKASLWSSSDTEPIELVMKRLEDIAESQKIKLKVFFAASSASSNTLTLATAKFSELGCYIHETDKVEILGVMMIASSYDYDETIRLLEDSFLGNIYSRLLVMQFKTLLQSNIGNFLSGEELDNYHNAKLLTEMDKVMYKTYGFSSMEEFFSRMQMKYYLGSIKVPMLTLIAEDDPLYVHSHGGVVNAAIPAEVYTQNPNIVLFVSSHGNHNGFFEGSMFQMFTNTESYHYPSNVAAVFIEKCLARRSLEGIQVTDLEDVEKTGGVDYIFEEVAL